MNFVSATTHTEEHWRRWILKVCKRHLSRGWERLMWSSSGKGLRGAGAVEAAERRNPPRWEHPSVILRWLKQLLLLFKGQLKLFMAAFWRSFTSGI